MLVNTPLMSIFTFGTLYAPAAWIFVRKLIHSCIWYAPQFSVTLHSTACNFPSRLTPTLYSTRKGWRFVLQRKDSSRLATYFTGLPVFCASIAALPVTSPESSSLPPKEPPTVVWIRRIFGRGSPQASAAHLRPKNGFAQPV